MWSRFTVTEQTSTGKLNQCCQLWQLCFYFVSKNFCFLNSQKQLAAKLELLSCYLVILWLWCICIDADTSQPQTDEKTCPLFVSFMTNGLLPSPVLKHFGGQRQRLQPQQIRTTPAHASQPHKNHCFDLTCSFKGLNISFCSVVLLLLSQPNNFHYLHIKYAN